MLSAKKDVVVLNFDSARRAHLVALLAHGVEQGVLEPHQLGIDLYPELDVASIADPQRP